MDALMAVDPGVKSMGVACFSRDNKLLWVELERADSLYEMLGNVSGYVYKNVHTVVERPQVYRHGPGDPNDLISLALVAGAWGGSADRTGLIEFVLPRQWKGNVPKDIHQPKILASLDPDERQLVEGIRPKSLRHNVIDAVGIGLWKLGRI